MILLTGFYQEADANRREEFRECLRRNLENNWLDEIHLFIEDSVDQGRLLEEIPLLTAAKIRLVMRGRRTTFREFFAYANQLLAGQDVIIANADIFFDHALAR